MSKQLFAKIASVQAEMPILHKEKKQGMRYAYITLEEIQIYLNPLLSKHGLCVVHLLETAQHEGVAIRTIVMDLESGETLESVFELPKTDLKSVNDTQAIGASITYGKRYSLVSLFRINGTDNDTDGQSERQLASIEEMKFRASTMLNSSRLPEQKKTSLQRQIPYIEDRDVLASICQEADKAGGHL